MKFNNLKPVLKRTLCALLVALLMCGTTARANDGLNLGNITLEGGTTISSSGSKKGNAPTTKKRANAITYNEYALNNASKDFLASVDGNITLTLLADEIDYACGEYNEYYYDFFASDNTYYRSVIDLLKTVCEWSDNIKLVFLDPFSVTSHSFMNTYKDMGLNYGDIFISCHTNFDGNPRTRTDIIKQSEFFNFTTDQNGLNKITSLNLESVLLNKLYELRTSRDINVALINDINGSGYLDYLKTHLDGRGYKLDSITLESEKLYGYDMIIIASPVRDVTLEEIVLIDTFLSHENKSVMYFAPESYVGLQNLYSYFSKWGVNLVEECMLYTSKTGEYFSSYNQLYAKSCGTDYTKNADELSNFYIMNNCTPIKVLKNIQGVSVKTLLNTSSNEVKYVPKHNVRNEIYKTSKGNQPLATVSTKGSSKISVFSSVDFIDSYFALQNGETENFKKNTNGNLEFCASLLESLNFCHRAEVSGLAEYAVSISEMGYDTTTGLETDYILIVSVLIGAVFMLTMLIALFIFNRRKKHDR